MKILPQLLIITLGIASCSRKSEEPKLITKTYENISPAFFEGTLPEYKENRRKRSDGVGESETDIARAALEARGMSFGKGTYAKYDKEKRILTIRNTSDQIFLIENR